MVRLLSAYSNKFTQLESLCELLSNCANTPTQPRKVEMTAQPWAIRHRLTPTQINDLVTAFQAGTHQKDLAERYGISLYSVKQLLKAAGARRYSSARRSGART